MFSDHPLGGLTIFHSTFLLLACSVCTKLSTLSLELKLCGPTIIVLGLPFVVAKVVLPKFQRLYRLQLRSAEMMGMKVYRKES